MLRTKDVPYVYSRDGIFYFTRRDPKDLQGHYRCPRSRLGDFVGATQLPLIDTI